MTRIIVAVLSLLLALPDAASAILCSGTGPCTVTVKTDGSGDYSSLNAAFTGEATNLSTAERQITFLCSAPTGTADTTAAVWTGSSWESTSTYWAKIQAASSDWAGAAWSTSKYRVSVTNNHALSGTLTANDVLYVYGLQMEVASANANTYRTVSFSSGDGTVYHIGWSHLRHEYSGSTYNGPNIAIGTGGASARAYYWDSIFTSRSTRSNAANVNVSTFGSTAGAITYAYSCTIIGGYYGLRNNANSGSTLEIENTYAGNTLQADFSSLGGTNNMRNCASEDSTAAGTSPMTGVAWSTLHFNSTTAGSLDLSLKLNATIRDNGADTTGESAPLNFTNDIRQYDRSGTWDRGAWDYDATAPAAPAAPAVSPSIFRSIFLGGFGK